MQQLILPFNLSSESTFAQYFPGQNMQLCLALREMARGRGEYFIYLWGANGLGKTHLLHACCHVASELGLQPMYLSLSNVADWETTIFDDLEKKSLVCIDDIEGIVGRPLWEEAFFDFYNRLHDAGHRLIVSGNAAPKDLNLSLSDLTSRLEWGVVFHLAQLSEAEKRQALRDRAKQYGFELSDTILDYLFHHTNRDLASLLKLLERIDQSSLELKRKVSIPFIRALLKELKTASE